MSTAHNTAAANKVHSHEFVISETVQLTQKSPNKQKNILIEQGSLDNFLTKEKHLLSPVGKRHLRVFLRSFFLSLSFFQHTHHKGAEFAFLALLRISQ